MKYQTCITHLRIFTCRSVRNIILYILASMLFVFIMSLTYGVDRASYCAAVVMILSITDLVWCNYLFVLALYFLNIARGFFLNGYLYLAQTVMFHIVYSITTTIVNMIPTELRYGYNWPDYPNAYGQKWWATSDWCHNYAYIMLLLLILIVKYTSRNNMRIRNVIDKGILSGHPV